MSQILADMANSVANEMLSPCELLGLYYHPFLRSIWEVVSKQLIVPSSAPLQGRVWTNEYSKFHKYVIGWHLPWRITSIRILWIVVQILFYDLNEHSDSDFLCGLKSNTFCIPVSMGCSWNTIMTSFFSTPNIFMTSSVIASANLSFSCCVLPL